MPKTKVELRSFANLFSELLAKYKSDTLNALQILTQIN